MTAKILIVDDLKFNVDLLEEHLQNDLYEIHRAYNGQEALSNRVERRIAAPRSHTTVQAMSHTAVSDLCLPKAEYIEKRKHKY